MLSARLTPTDRATDAAILGPFLAISFGLTWGLAALLFVAYDSITALFGEVSASNPLFILAVYAPLIASIVMVCLRYGVRNLGVFLRRATLLRAAPGWWGFILIVIPLIMVAGATIKGTAIGPFPYAPWYLVFPAWAQTLLLGPMEEFGWCGIALPILQRKHSPFAAGLLHGVIWMTWHIPAFLIGGTPQSAWDFLPFACGGVACSLIITALFNQSQGSILLPALVHFQLNNPVWPDAQPWDNALIALCAIVVVWLNRRWMFRRGAGVTAVLPTDAVADASPAEPSTEGSEL